MKSETERVEPQLPCPQCRELMPADSPYCSACGAELYAQCPDCGTRRSAEDAFCRKCGFNFSRKKLRLKDTVFIKCRMQNEECRNPVARSEAFTLTHRNESERAETVPDHSLSRGRFQKPEKRAGYRMSPGKGTFRAILMLVFLALMAAAVFWGVYWIWENVSGHDLLDKFKQGQSAVLKWTALKQAVEPDWNTRRNYWVGYYRDVFAPPPADARVEVGLVNGNREQGVLVQITDDQVLLKKDGHELGFPRVLMDDATRRVFFPDDYASAGARSKVAAEKAAWKKQAQQQNAVPVRSSRFSCGSQPPPLPPPSPSANPFLKIKCPVCGGKGFYLIQVVVVKKEAREKTSIIRDEREICPVCGGRGYRRFEQYPEFPWPAGASRCGKCRGMGRTWYKVNEGNKKGVIKTRVCRACNHRGYVVNKWDAAHDVPPRY